LPGAVYSPIACLQVTFKTAREVGFPTDRLIFEITEAEQVKDRWHLRNIVNEYRKQGFKIAIDDFGAGYAGMNLLADLPTDIVKLDMELTRNIHDRPAAIAIVKSMVALSKTLGCQLIAEGIETVDEYSALAEYGITLMQGYLLARPQFEALPPFTLPNAEPHVESAAA
jgi:EAL domain-containing protein (putative c-di-GMP-specific phosphodiesterase class I)